MTTHSQSPAFVERGRQERRLAVARALGDDASHAHGRAVRREARRRDANCITAGG